MPIQSTPYQEGGIHRLGRDILWHLFNYITSLDDSTYPHWRIEGPRLLSQVCSSWRTLALECTFLWTEIFLILTDTCSKEHNYAKLCLERCKERPVAFYIEASRYLDPVEQDFIQQNSHRIKELLVITTRDYPSFFFPLHLTTAMPRLEKFETVIREGDIFRIERIPSAAPLQIVNSRTEEVCGWRLWTSPGVTSLAFVNMDGYLPTCLSFVLKALKETSTTLEFLEFSGVLPLTFNRYYDGPYRPIHLPRLREIKLGFVRQLGHLLELIDAPRLERLILRDVLMCPESPQPFTGIPNDNGRPDVPHVYSIAAGFTSLKELKIFAMFEAPLPNIVKCFQALELLETLVLYGPPKLESCNLIAALFYVEQPRERPLFPRLSVFACTLNSAIPHIQPFLAGRELHGLPRLSKLCVTEILLHPCLKSWGNFYPEMIKDMASYVCLIEAPSLGCYLDTGEEFIVIEGEFTGRYKRLALDVILGFCVPKTESQTQAEAEAKGRCNDPSSEALNYFLLTEYFSRLAGLPSPFSRL